MTDLPDIDKIDLKKTSATQQAAKKNLKNTEILKENVNLSNKKSKSRNNDIMFIQ